jgi:hypothetical protein
MQAEDTQGGNLWIMAGTPLKELHTVVQKNLPAKAISKTALAMLHILKDILPLPAL